MKQNMFAVPGVQEEKHLFVGDDEKDAAKKRKNVSIQYSGDLKFELQKVRYSNVSGNQKVGIQIPTVVTKITYSKHTKTRHLNNRLLSVQY